MERRNYTLGGMIIGILLFGVVIFAAEICAKVYEKTSVCLPLVCSVVEKMTFIENGTTSDGAPMSWGNGGEKTCTATVSL